MNLVVLCLGLLLAVCHCRHAHESLPTSSQSFQYTYQDFALSWPASFCSHKRCNPFWMNNWDRKSFIVHGLWPSSLHPNFLRMITRFPEDPRCTAPYKFNLGLLPQEAVQRLNQIMPDLTQNNLWAHEWNKHGVCYLKTIADRVNGPNRPIPPSLAQQGFVKYFQSIATLYARLSSGFRLQKQYYQNGDELARDLGLNPRSVKFTVRNGQLQEMTICTTLPTNLGMNEQIIPCQFPTRYSGGIRLPGFRGGFYN